MKECHYKCDRCKRAVNSDPNDANCGNVFQWRILPLDIAMHIKSDIEHEWWDLCVHCVADLRLFIQGTRLYEE